MKEIHVCQGRWCYEIGSESVLRRLKKRFAPLLGNKEAKVQGCKCLGHCEMGLNMLVDGKVVNEVDEDNCIDKVLDPSQHRDARTQPLEIDLEDDFLGDL